MNVSVVQVIGESMRHAEVCDGAFYFRGRYDIRLKRVTKCHTKCCDYWGCDLFGA